MQSKFLMLKINGDRFFTINESWNKGLMSIADLNIVGWALPITTQFLMLKIKRERFFAINESWNKGLMGIADLNMDGLCPSPPNF